MIGTTKDKFSDVLFKYTLPVFLRAYAQTETPFLILDCSTIATDISLFDAEASRLKALHPY